MSTTARFGAGLAASSLVPLAGRGQLPGSVAGAASLGSHAWAGGRLYGCAVNVRALATNPDYAQLIRQQCGILVAENEMKWAALRPGPETFRFNEADALVRFAEANRMKVRGHNLAWHRYNPKWFDTTVTAANARQMLVAHIQTVMRHYAGRIHSWDVVNEAIEVKDGRPDGLRNSAWLRLAGDDYIELAFRTAREADPKALLTYNDYGIEGESAEAEQKRAAVLGLLRRMRAHGVPIDAVGVQSHIAASGATYGAGLMRFLAAARELGLQVFITEMDVNDRTLAADNPSRDTSVASAYKDYLDLVLGDPAVRAVLTWGITDRYTWLNSEDSRKDGQPERPLLFDSDYKPKSAFFAARGAFDGDGLGKGGASAQK
jgi:endo-1,4-beta-xylanase